MAVNEMLRKELECAELAHSARVSELERQNNALMLQLRALEEQVALLKGCMLDGDGSDASKIELAEMIERASRRTNEHMSRGQRSNDRLMTANEELQKQLKQCRQSASAEATYV